MSKRTDGDEYCPQHSGVEAQLTEQKAQLSTLFSRVSATFALIVSLILAGGASIWAVAESRVSNAVYAAHVAENKASEATIAELRNATTRIETKVDLLLQVNAKEVADLAKNP